MSMSAFQSRLFGSGGMRLWLCLIMPAMAIEAFNVSDSNVFRYDRDALLAGEFWRLITGHLDHLNLIHLLLNAAFLALCILLFQPLRNWAWSILIWLVAAISISLLLLAFDQDIAWYVGLSGSLYTLFVLGACFDTRYSILARIVLLGLVLGKVILEQYTPVESLSSSWLGHRVIVEAHLYGSLTGIVLFGIFWTWQRMHKIKSIEGYS